MIYFNVPVKSLFVASSVLIAMGSTLAISVSTQATIPTFIAQTKPAPQTDAAKQQLLGQWQTKDPESGDLVTFIFAPEGKLFILFPAPEGAPESPPVALGIKYQINSTAKPGQIDLVFTEEESIKSIFEFTDKNQLRVELEGRKAGQSRPTAFSSEATVFEKVSETTTLPANTQVIDLETEKKNAADNQLPRPQSEAKLYIGMMNKAQQVYYREQGKFATEFEETGLGTEPGSAYYTYRLTSPGNEKESVMITAQAKDSKLPSYTGVVFVTKSNGKATTIATICETIKPSTSPPAMPTAPSSGSSEIKCPDGSRPIQ